MGALLGLVWILKASRFLAYCMDVVL